MMFKPCSCATSSLIASWTIRCCFTRFAPLNADETTVTFMNEPHPPAAQKSVAVIVCVARRGEGLSRYGSATSASWWLCPSHLTRPPLPQSRPEAHAAAKSLHVASHGRSKRTSIAQASSAQRSERLVSSGSSAPHCRGHCRTRGFPMRTPVATTGQAAAPAAAAAAETEDVAATPPA